MAEETYGVVEAQRRFREWMPYLKTLGQRAVYGALLSFFSIDGTATPTASQLAKLVRMHPASVRKIMRQLEEIGAVVRVGERPNLTAAGVARGGRIPVFSIPKRASEGASGDSQARSEAIPSAPKRVPKRASKGAQLNVEKLNVECQGEEEEKETGPVRETGESITDWIVRSYETQRRQEKVNA